MAQPSNRLRHFPSAVQASATDHTFLQAHQWPHPRSVWASEMQIRDHVSFWLRCNMEVHFKVLGKVSRLIGIGRDSDGRFSSLCRASSSPYCMFCLFNMRSSQSNSFLGLDVCCLMLRFALFCFVAFHTRIRLNSFKQMADCCLLQVLCPPYPF